MDEIVETPAFVVAGIALRTSNQEAMTTIPAQWHRFLAENLLDTIPGRRSNDLYAVYTEFTNEGVDNEGNYTFIIGANVDPAIEIPAHLTRVVIPAGRRVRFSVPDNDFGRVGEVWAEIWRRTDLAKTFVAEYEHYPVAGEIAIHVGVASA